MERRSSTRGISQGQLQLALQPHHLKRKIRVRRDHPEGEGRPIVASPLAGRKPSAKLLELKVPRIIHLSSRYGLRHHFRSVNWSGVISSATLGSRGSFFVRGFGPCMGMTQRVVSGKCPLGTRRLGSYPWICLCLCPASQQPGPVVEERTSIPGTTA